MPGEIIRMQYIFQCQNQDCKNEFEIYAKIGTLIVKDLICPECKGKDIKRKWLPTVVHYRGGGFSKQIKQEKEQ